MAGQRASSFATWCVSTVHDPDPLWPRFDTYMFKTMDRGVIPQNRQRIHILQSLMIYELLFLIITDMQSDTVLRLFLLTSQVTGIVADAANWSLTDHLYYIASIAISHAEPHIDCTSYNLWEEFVAITGGGLPSNHHAICLCFKACLFSSGPAPVSWQIEIEVSETRLIFAQESLETDPLMLF